MQSTILSRYNPCRLILLTLLASVFALPALGHHLAEEFDSDWDPDMTNYLPSPQFWPLCGDISTEDPNWDEGEDCNSSDPDRVVSVYGPRKQSGNFDFHRGLDLRTVEMESDNDDSTCDESCLNNPRPVFAVEDGHIEEIEYKCKSGRPDGFRIELEHETDFGNDTLDWTTRYVHLSSVAILDSTITAPTCPTSGSQSWDWAVDLDVTAGQHIGYTGKSQSNNHHLHFEVRKDEGWARSAVHPVRIMPTAPSVSGSTVSFSGFGSGQPEVEFTGGLVDVVRVDLEEQYCTEGAGGALTCTAWALISGSVDSHGYLDEPPFYDIERNNYQFAHRGGSRWDDTNDFEHCPFAADHDGYDSDLHLTADDTTVYTFNGATATVYGGVTPNKRRVRFDALSLPWDPAYDRVCLRPIARTVANGDLVGGSYCRTESGGDFDPAP